MSWYMCESCVTTPITSRKERWVTSRTSRPPTSTAPPVTSYIRETSDDSVVLPAPDGPTTATNCPGSTVKLTSLRTSSPVSADRVATDSSEASDTSSADG